jgi:hypothetical protein
MKHLFILFLLIILTNLIASQPVVWTEKVSGVTTPLYSAFGNNSFHIYWVCGTNGVVLKTTNSGDNWTLRNSGIPSNITLVTISDALSGPDIALTAGNIGTTTYVYRTSNGGANWTQVFTQPNGKINTVRVWNGFMAGNPVNGRWSLWKTTNAGLTWDSTGLYLPQNGNELGWSNSLEITQCGSDITYWMGTNNYRIYRSTNEGINWTPISTGSLQNTFTVRMNWFISQGHGYAGGSNLMRTTNCGTTWDTVMAPGAGNFGALAFGEYGVDSDIPWEYFGIFAVRNDNKIYYTLPNGSNWNEYTAPSGTYTYVDAASSGGPFVAVRDNGGISWFCCFWGAVQKLGSEIPSNYKLFQNYPNPFNPETKIKFDITKTGNTIIKIYDAAGAEIKTLINEQLQPGTYEAEWDGSNYPSGVYFYKFITSNFSETKKMVLIK